MDDLDTQDSQEELSKDDLEVLQAFHDLEFSTTDDSFPREHNTRGLLSRINQSRPIRGISI